MVSESSHTLPASASRGHSEGRGGRGRQESLAPTLVGCKHQSPSGGCFFSVEVFLSVDGNQTCSLRHCMGVGPECVPSPGCATVCVPSPGCAPEGHPSITHHRRREAPVGGCCHKAELRLLKLWAYRVSSCVHLQCILDTKCFLFN